MNAKTHVRIREEILEDGSSLYYPQHRDIGSSHWQDIYEEYLLSLEDARHWTKLYLSRAVVDTKYHTVDDDE